MLHGTDARTPSAAQHQASLFDGQRSVLAHEEYRKILLRNHPEDEKGNSAATHPASSRLDCLPDLLIKMLSKFTSRLCKVSSLRLWSRPQGRLSQLRRCFAEIPVHFDFGSTIQQPKSRRLRPLRRLNVLPLQNRCTRRRALAHPQAHQCKQRPCTFERAW